MREWFGDRLSPNGCGISTFAVNAALSPFSGCQTLFCPAFQTPFGNRLGETLFRGCLPTPKQERNGVSRTAFPKRVWERENTSQRLGYLIYIIYGIPFSETSLRLAVGSLRFKRRAGVALMEPLDSWESAKRAVFICMLRRMLIK